MFEETKKGFDWFSLIVGILFIIAGIASFTRPDKTLHFLAIVAGIAFIFRGIYELWFRQRIGRILGESSGWFNFFCNFRYHFRNYFSFPTKLWGTLHCYHLRYLVYP